MKETSAIAVFRPYFALLQPVRGYFILSLVSGLVYGVAGGFGFPFLAYKIFPLVFSSPPPDFWVVAGAALLLPAAFTIRGISGFFNAYYSAYCGVRVLNTLKEKIHAKMQALPLAFFFRNRPGDLMTRINGDAQSVQLVVTTVANDLVKQPVTFIGALAALIYMAVQKHEIMFIVFCLGLIPLSMIPLRAFGKKILTKSQELQRSAGNVNAIVHESISAAREIRAFNLQEREKSRYRELLEKVAGYAIKATKYTQLLNPVVEILSAIGISAAIIYASSKRIPLAEVVPLMTALYMSYDPIKKLGVLQGKIKRGQASVERIEYILQADESIPDPEVPVPFNREHTDVQFEHVNFAYTNEPALKNVSVHIPAGSIAALVGPSGAGKSTFVNLIPRFYDPVSGSIRIGGQDIRSFSKQDLREHISMVSQDTLLFNDTIRNNIRLGRMDATDAEVETAARQASAHEFIMGFSDGYETMASERGARFSGGQKQRIAIARAFLKNAPILIMDEATSSLDSESEEMVQRALSELIKGKTVLIIAHRFSTIKMAERILIFDKGQLRTVGAHDQLYVEDPLYRSLYDRQYIS